ARRAIGYNELVTDSLMVTVAPNARLSRPYWRHASEHDGWVTVEPDAPIGLPWRPPDVVGHAVFAVNGIPVEITQPLQFRTADKAFGEIRREVLVAPALAVSLTPEMAVIPMAGAHQPRRFRVSVWNNVRGRASGTLRLDLPDGWSATPPEASFSFTRQDQEVTVAFDVTPPRAIPAGAYRVRAVAEWNGQRFTEGYRTIAYPHIETRHLYREAASEVRVFEIRVADGLTVGYIMGGGDDVPQALSQLGVNMRLLGPEDLATGDLSQYDVIVAGIRAYEVRDDLIAHNQRLLEYVKAGGTYIVQYNKYEFNAEQYGPYPAKIRQPHDRVTREDAPVTILDPTNPVFNVPNKITSADFDGWVQERGLYFLGEWDSRYVPLLACNDPGEEPKRGGLVEAHYGKGLYIYTGYAWFRQLPAGLPGAYRLFANLISLPKAHQ
ncbi:MAG: hypothetical protein HY710_06620, partial [Candidatus Latescibacteria bacterium]|nr:hypothetical protein [Candidatus Latescibacterota bacterium]